LGFFESLESVSPSPLEGDAGSSLLAALLPDEDVLPVVWGRTKKS
jgi:DNA-binding transcriptional regulator LsrR (DeoR family)